MERRGGDGVPDVEEVVSLCAGELSEIGVEIVAERRGDGEGGILLLLLLLLMGVEVGGEKMEAREESGEDAADWGVLVGCRTGGEEEEEGEN